MSTRFSPLSYKTSCEKNLCKSNWTFKDTNARLIILATHYSQIVKANGFLKLKVQDFPKTFVTPYHLF
jgi:hypothetical protein